MAGLKITDLTNTYNTRNSSSDYIKNYPHRKDKFLEKVDKREAFELTNGDKVFVNDPGSKGFLEKMRRLRPGSQNETLGKALVVFSPEYVSLPEDDLDSKKIPYKKVSLSSFEKTSEFGSSKETTAGSTEDVESMVATVLAFNLSGMVKENIIPSVEALEQLIAQKRLVGVKSVESLHSSLDNLSLDPSSSWFRTIQGSAVELQKHCGLTGDYDIYRTPSEGVPGQIYSLFRSLNSRYGNVNKWNPADIWAVRRGYRFPNQFLGWDEFNQAVRVAFDEKNAIGISLKQLGSNPSVELVNETGKKKDTSHHIAPEELEQATFQVTGKGSCKIIVPSKGEISIRCANVSGATSFNMEIGWSERAQDGKASLPAINYEFKKQGSRLLPTHLGIHSDIVKQLQEEGSEIQQDFINLLQEAGLDPAKYLDNTPGGLLSKYLGLICYHNYIQESFDRVQFLNGILDYAMSRTDEAAPHYKIH